MEGPRTGGKLFRFSFLKRDHFRIERASLNAKEAQHRRPREPGFAISRFGHRFGTHL